jgi:hypothetical protein
MSLSVLILLNKSDRSSGLHDWFESRSLTVALFLCKNLTLHYLESEVS